MERKDRLQKAYNYLRNKGVIHTQEEVANRMQSTASNMSKAMKGAENVLTDNFLRRFNDAFGNIFSLQWLILGEGEMLLDGNEEENDVEFGQSETSRFLSMLEKKDEQIDRLITLLEQKFGINEKKERRVG